MTDTDDSLITHLASVRTVRSTVASGLHQQHSSRQRTAAAAAAATMHR